MSYSAEIIAMTLIFAVHVIGAGILIWAMLDGEEGRPDWRALWPRDDEGGEGPPPPEPDAPRPSGPGVPLLPDAFQSSVRLREPGRLSDALPRPARRPAHVPEPAHEPSRTDDD